MTMSYFYEEDELHAVAYIRRPSQLYRDLLYFLTHQRALEQLVTNLLDTITSRRSPSNKRISHILTYCSRSNFGFQPCLDIPHFVKGLAHTIFNDHRVNSRVTILILHSSHTYTSNMAEQLVLRGELHGHTGWVTSLATSAEK